jgi:hypothetical protein
MGLDYAYEMIVARPAVHPLLRAFAAHLAPADGRRLLAAIDAGECEVMRHIARQDYEQSFADTGRGGGDVCFSFHFLPDAELTEYDKDSRMARVPARVPVGCVWTSVRCGKRFAVVRATAATTGMSRLFERSQSVRSTFMHIGQVGGALLVLFDDEQGDFGCVWPHTGRLAFSGDAEDFYDDTFELETDRYCEHLLTSAADTFGSGHAGAGA